MFDKTKAWLSEITVQGLLPVRNHGAAATPATACVMRG